LCESDAAAANEPHQLIRLLHLLDLSFVDQHPVSAFSLKKLSRRKCDCQLKWLMLTLAGF
jgi:hypothetical protein